MDPLLAKLVHQLQDARGDDSLAACGGAGKGAL